MLFINKLNLNYLYFCLKNSNKIQVITYYSLTYYSLSFFLSLYSLGCLLSDMFIVILIIILIIKFVILYALYQYLKAIFYFCSS